MLHHSAIQVGNWVYVIGGCPNGDCTSNTNRVQRARINSDGTLGPFATYSTSAVSRHGHNLAVVNGYLYILGGPGQSSIERAKINDADGNLGAFSVIGNMPQTRHWAGSAVMGSRIYLFGGTDGGPGILIIPVNDDGSLGAMTLNPFHMTTSRWGQGVFTYGGAIYNLGGVSGSDYLASVERCTVNADGTLSAGTVVGSMITGRFIVTPVVAGNNVYVWGGGNGGQWGRDLQNLEVAEINADGTLQPFRAVGSNLATWGQTVTRVGDQIYKTGGFDGTSQFTTVEQATIYPGGGISPWRKVGDLKIPRHHHNAVRIKDFLYVLAGWAPSGDNRSGERAEIKPDGSLGPFVVMPQALVFRRGGTSSKVIGDYLYVTGGGDGGTQVVYDTIERAKINADGSIGDFELYSGSRLIQRRMYHGFVAIGDWAYLFGGRLGWVGTNFSSVEKARIAPDGSLGPFMTAPGLPRIAHGMDSDGFGVVGNWFYIFGAYDSAPYAAIMRAPIGAGGSLGAWETYPFGILQGRWHQSVVVGDGAVYVIGGASEFGAETRPEGRVEVASWW